MCLRLRFSFATRNGMETGLRSAHRFISNFALSAFTNERDDVKAEERIMGKFSLT